MTLLPAQAPGTACLPCLTIATGLHEAQILDSLQRLGDSVIMTMGSCSRCTEDRLVCELPAD